ncbi:hypothetical protein ACMGDK_11375 [Chryseobacterium sp. DT-3]|uniref:hypothetical protein n=1 Tax=Chryseobacterium sp. DT-3 TaxID=3396164 RepID=UPI003F1D68BD
MALLKIKVKERTRIIWGEASLYFVRSVDTTQETTITFDNATGQTFIANQVFYSSGTIHTPGYISFSSKNSVTLNGDGIFYVNIEHFPTSTQTNNNITFNIDGSPASFNFIYNSKPAVTDLVVETDNRTDYIFSMTEFLNHSSDFDNDSIDYIRVNGDTTGFKHNAIDYISGTWVPKDDITGGIFIYHPLDQDAEYEKNNTWDAMDSQGNISVG